MKKMLMNLLTSGIETELETGVRSRVVFLNSVTLAGGIMIALFSALGFSSGNTSLGLACLVSAAVVFANFAFVRLTKRFVAGGAVDCGVIFFFYYYLVLTGGEAGSGILWIMTYPLITLFLLGPLWGSAVALVFLAATAVAIFTPSLNVANFPPLYSARIVGTFFFIWVFGLIYELVRRSAQSRVETANANLTAVTKELVTEKKQTDDILQSVREGIFLLGADHCLGGSYSAHLESVLERTELEGTDFLEIIAPAIGEKEMDSVRDYLGFFLSGSVNEALLADINPLAEVGLVLAKSDGSSAFKRLRFSFSRIASPSARFPILGVVSDVTDEYELKTRLDQEEKDHRRRMESLFQIIHVDPAMMREFIADTEAELETVNELMRQEGGSGKDVLETLFQSAHAIKGNAALLGLTEFSAKVHSFEDRVKAKLEGGHEWRDLLELTLGLAEIAKELENIKALIDKILRFQTDVKAAGLEDSNLLRFSVEKLVKQEAARSGILAVAEFQGFGRRTVPNEYRKLVKDVLIQLIRNSFAHGFESPEIRTQKGKTEVGRINLSLEWAEDSFTIRYADDGKGLDAGAIRRKAKAIPEIASQVDGMNGGELAKLIFRPGFSTSALTDMGSGRGVGMSLVKSRIADAGGKLAVKSAAGRSLEFAFTLPLGLTERAVS